jgi:hypothetical protein
MITIKELSIDTESATKIINLIKKHEPKLWEVFRHDLAKALAIPDVVGQSEQLVCPHCADFEFVYACLCGRDDSCNSDKAK